MFSFLREFTKPKEDKNTNWGIGLPHTVMRNVLFGYHSLDEAKNFATVSDEANKAYELPLLAARFVEHVAKGEQSEAEEILQKNENLTFYFLTQKVSVSDHSGREFIKITALQYAAWALDRHMWTMLKKYMSENEVKTQLEEMIQAGGVEYRLPTKSSEEKTEIIREMHYEFSELTRALQNFINVSNGYFSPPQTHNYENLLDAIKLLNTAQCNAPAHIANEYCHPLRSFATVPDFKSDVALPRTFKISRSKAVWFPIEKREAKGAVFRANYDCPVNAAAAIHHPWLDLAAMISLGSVRMSEFTMLIESLSIKFETPDRVPKANFQ